MKVNINLFNISTFTKKFLAKKNTTKDIFLITHFFARKSRTLERILLLFVQVVTKITGLSCHTTFILTEADHS